MPFTDYGYYSNAPVPYEGSIASSGVLEVRALRNILSTPLAYGRAVVHSVLSGANDNDAQLPTATGQLLLGISKFVGIDSYFVDAQGNVGIRPNAAFDAIWKGNIGVFVETAVALDDPVYFRHTPNGANVALGRFRNTADSASTGTGATGTVTLTAGAVSSVTITNGGQYYNSVPTVVFSGGGSGSGASGTAVISNGQVTGVTGIVGGTTYTGTVNVAFTATSSATADLISRARWVTSSTSSGIVVLDLNLP